MDDRFAARRAGYLREDYRLFHLRDTAGQERDYHFHEFDKLVILLAGHVTYELENAVYPLQPWDVLLVKHHTIHKAVIDTTAPYERIILYLDRRYVERTAPGAELMACFEQADLTGRHRLVPDARERELLAPLLSGLEEAQGSTRFGAAVLGNALLLQLLVHLNRIALKGVAAPPVPAEHSDKIAQTLTYIHENLGQPLTVDRLAARVYLSRSHFMRLFKEETGRPVHVYIRQRRLLHAAKLIRDGTPAGQAAAASGYSDYSAFFRAFRECFGASPNDIR